MEPGYGSMAFFRKRVGRVCRRRTPSLEQNRKCTL